jgi:mono/diheme cytochrome c family protein
MPTCQSRHGIVLGLSVLLERLPEESLFSGSTTREKTMRAKFSSAFIIAAAVSMTTAHAQQTAPPTQSDRGKYEYDAHCAVCHGLGGKGDGILVGVLKSAVPDLTVLSRKNNGVFPFAHVYETIDGTQSVAAHGTRQMPVWGPRYKAEVGESMYDDYRSEPEVFVRARILALTEYIYRLQSK